MNVAIVGGGAAGFFAALSVKEHHPDASVSILEKGNGVLRKVKVSGGGRCNVTNAERSVKELAKAYPRGGNSLKKAFGVFGTGDTVEWFAKRGVGLAAQDDGCVFPTSQNSQTVIDCFLAEAAETGIDIRRNRGIAALEESGGRWAVTYAGDTAATESFDKVIVATGGHPDLKDFDWLIRLGHTVEPPVPSLFTFNMPGENIRALQGIVVEGVIAAIQGTSFEAEGTLLITHWGMSGPVILKLSSYGARYLNGKGYEAGIRLNWTGLKNSESAAGELERTAAANPAKMLSSLRPFSLPDRLWRFLIDKSGLTPAKKWGELGKKGLNRITAVLTNDSYRLSGRAAFKEEFVTCGGVSLAEIDMATMQSRKRPNLYFAGEVLDIDGITGGFNFQAAWTTGYIAGKLQ